VTALGATLLYLQLNSSYSITPWSLFPAIFTMGFGMGLCFGTLFDVVIGDIAQDEAGSASGSLSAVQQLAGSVGSAVITSVFFSAMKIGGHIHAMEQSLIVAVAAMSVCFGLVWLLPNKVGNSHG